MEVETPTTLLCIVAHADDIEFCIGGSVAKWIQAGAEVHYLIVSDGCRGTDADTSSAEIVAARRAEQTKA